MCGIVGIISGFNNGFSQPEQETFNDMLYMDALRGTDGTGVMYGTNQNDVHIIKEATPAWKFMSTLEWKTAAGSLLNKGKWAVGHNRAATRGDKKDENSHPFYVQDKIILVQNGTYRGDHQHLAKTEVDSEAIAHVLAEEDDVEKALQKINAAYALVWFNAETNNLHIIRNVERPLWLGRTAAGAVVFSSEPWIAHAAASRRGLSLKGMDPVEVGKLYTFNMLGKSFKEEEPKPLDITYKGRVWQYQNFSTNCWGEDLEPHREPIRLPHQQQHHSRNTHHPFERRTITERAEDINFKYLTLLNHKDTQELSTYMAPLEKTTAYVEVVEIVRVYDSPNTKAFYVFGKIFDTSEKVNNLMVAWECVLDNDEEFMNTLDTIYKVTFDGGVLRRPYYANGHEDLNIVVLSVKSPEPVAAALDAHEIPPEEITNVIPISSLH